MDVCTAIKERRSVRAFLDKPVPLDLVHTILEDARWAPSGVNHQPWQVAILGKNTRDKLSKLFIEARETGKAENPDYNYYPQVWEEPYKSRRKACGAALYGALNIAYDDKAARKTQWYKNYYFFGAPMALIIHIDSKLDTGSWMDVGGFLQSIMLSARGHGLETCPQASLAEYPDLVRQTLQLDNSRDIVCGLAMGYADWSDPVNQYRTAREPLENFVRDYD